MKLGGDTAYKCRYKTQVVADALMITDATRSTICCPLLGYIVQLNTIYMGTAIWSDLRIRAMTKTHTFFNPKFDNGVNKGLNWFGINQMVSFKDITQNRFSKMAKISHSAELEIC